MTRRRRRLYRHHRHFEIWRRWRRRVLSLFLFISFFVVADGRRREGGGHLSRVLPSFGLRPRNVVRFWHKWPYYMTRDEHCSAFLSSPGVRVVGRVFGLIRPTLVPKSRHHRAEMKCYCSKAPRPSFVRLFFLAKKRNNLTNNKKRKEKDAIHGRTFSFPFSPLMLKEKHTNNTKERKEQERMLWHFHLVVIQTRLDLEH